MPAGSGKTCLNDVKLDGRCLVSSTGQAGSQERGAQEAGVHQGTEGVGEEVCV